MEKLTAAEIAEARTLIAKDEAARVKPDLPVNGREYTIVEMETYNAWIDRDQLFADWARPLVPRLLDETKRLSDAVKFVCNDLETLINHILEAEVHSKEPTCVEAREALTVLRLARKAVEEY